MDATRTIADAGGPSASRVARPVGRLVLGLAFTGTLLWFAHVALDRAAGYGQRTPDGWQRV
jgi:hypothetical protein